MWGAAGNHRSDFDLIAVVEHFIFCYEIVAFDHEMRFDDEIQFAQEFLDLLGAFDLDGSGWMAELDLHGGIIGWPAGTRQGAVLVRREGLGVKYYQG
jgi:hypothetical protein